jgi:dihydroxy-acid dehydratase
MGRISSAELDAIERHTCPGEGACGGMYTANTMAAAAEALGMSLPGSAAPPAVDRRRDEFAVRSGEAVVGMLERGLTARAILTLEAFENAVTVVMALGGSTNAVLHLLAIAHEAGVPVGLQPHRRPHSPSRRRQALRSVRHGRRRSGRGHPGRHAHPAGRRSAAR